MSSDSPAAAAQRRKRRPPKHPVDVLFTRIWFAQILRAYDLSGPREVACRLNPHKVELIRNSEIRIKKWEQYRNGAHTPLQSEGRCPAVYEAENEWPGTAIYFDNDLRKILKGWTPTLLELNESLGRLPQPIPHLFSERSFWSTQEGVHFERCAPITVLDALDDLASIGTLDALTALGLAMAASGGGQTWGAAVIGKSALWLIRRRMEFSEDIAPFANELRAFISARFHELEFASEDEKRRVFDHYMGRKRTRFQRDQRAAQTEARSQRRVV